MRNKIIGFCMFILFIVLCTSGLITDITKFFTWLVTLNYPTSDISFVGEIFVKTASFIISYISVWLIFNYLNWFNSDIMKLAYFIISTLVSFALCYIVMKIEQYLLVIVIVTAILLVGLIIVSIVIDRMSKKKKDSSNEELKEAK